jgi:hypothetical protein
VGATVPYGVAYSCRWAWLSRCRRTMGCVDDVVEQPAWRFVVGPWVVDAGCAGLDGFLETPTADMRSMLVRVCANCPVLADCRAYAESASSLYGWWAGEWHDGTRHLSSRPRRQQTAA